MTPLGKASQGLVECSPAAATQNLLFSRSGRHCDDDGAVRTHKRCGVQATALLSIWLTEPGRLSEPVEARLSGTAAGSLPCTPSAATTTVESATMADRFVGWRL